MALFRRENIAVPDQRKDQIVYKWPDQQIRRFSRAIVAPDETAVFMFQGQVIGTLPPGRHMVDAKELPFLGMFKDILTANNAYRTELYFVSSREILDRFGGQIDEVQDPQTGLLVTLRVFGEYVMKVTDPVTLIVKYAGTQDQPSNDKVFALTEELLLRGLRQDLTRQIVRAGWPVLGLAAYTDDMEKAAVESGNHNLGDYGLAVVRLTNFTVTLDEATEAQLRQLAKDTAYSRLAGGFQQYAAGEMALGAGQGMAQGGGQGSSAAFLAAGVGLGGQMTAGAAQTQPGPPPPPAPGFTGGGAGYGAQQPGGGQVTCAKCGTGNPASAHFCASCGAALPTTVECPACHAQNQSGAHFCASCGAAMQAAAARCANCQAELAPDARFCASCGTPVGGTGGNGPGETPPPAPAGGTPPAPEGGTPPAPPAG